MRMSLTSATLASHLPSGSSSCCDTFLKKIDFSFTWNIHNFSIRPEENKDAISSSTFSAGMDYNLLWCLDLYPKGQSEESKGFLSVFLRFLSNNKCIKAKYTISIVNCILEEECEETSKVVTFCAETRVSGFPTFIGYDYILDESNGLLCNDKLTLYCEITAYHETIDTSGRIDSFPIQFQTVPECKSAEDFEKLFECTHFTDVILSVKGHELYAHKSILSARSPVFAAMFKMKEAKHNRIKIADMDYEVFKEILHFLYRGKTDRLREMPKELLVAANKYKLIGLKTMCEKVLCKPLTVEGASDALIWADIHDAAGLKGYAIYFIREHFADVKFTEGWKSMVECRPDLIDELQNVQNLIATSHNMKQKE